MRRPKTVRDLLQNEEEGRLLYLLDTTEPLLQAKISLELGRRGIKASIEPLRRRLSSPDSQLREAAAEALGKIGDPASGADILRLFKDTQQPTSVRDTCAYALARLGYRPAVPALISALADSSESVRVCAVAALAATGDRNVVEPIKLALQTETHTTVRAAMKNLLASVKSKPLVSPRYTEIREKLKYQRLPDESAQFLNPRSLVALLRRVA